MADPEKNITYFTDLIDDYFDSNLPLSDLKEIEASISDDEIRKAIQAHILARVSIRKLGDEKEKAKFLNKFHGKNHVESNVKALNKSITKTILKYIYPLAACVILVVATWNLLPNLSSLGKSEALDLNYTPSVDLIRSDLSEPIHQEWNNAMQAFSQQKFNKALEILAEIEKDDLFLNTNKGKFHLYKGSCLLHTNRHEEAQENLLRISTSNPFYDQAQWLLAISYYKSSMFTEAKELLLGLEMNMNFFKQSEAKKLLSKIPEN